MPGFTVIKGSEHIVGHVEAGYEKVKAAFQNNFEVGDEIGAGIVVYVGEQKVAELYGGYHDNTHSKPYNADSINVVFSCGKALTSIIVAKYVDQGLLDLNKTVAEYWPEFAEGGKENVLVKELLAHRGGVGGMDPERIPTLEELKDLDVVAKKIAGQPHNFDGEPIQAYHGTTRDWYVNEIIRRVDPDHRSLGTIARTELNTLFGVELFFGLPEELEPRVAPIHPVSTIRTLLEIYVFTTPESERRRKLVRELLNSKSLAYKTSKSVPSAPKPHPHGSSLNLRAMHAVESPSFAGISNAKTLARFAAIMANNGAFDGINFISPKTIDQMMEPMPAMTDVVVFSDVKTTAGGFGTFSSAFPGLDLSGWGGAGGSMILWNREHKVAIGYTMNATMTSPFADVHKTRRLAASVIESLKDQKLIP